jgi:SAM-dependent methyltransferase
MARRPSPSSPGPSTAPGGARFDPTGALLVSTGDNAVGTNPQDTHSLAGKVLRIDAATGRPAAGNPFLPRPGAGSPYVYTYGHRNVQGLAVRPGGSQVYAVEQGTFRDDEVNLLRAGANYGYDPVGRGRYDESVPMTDPAIPGAVPAVWSSGPATIATCGGTFLSGRRWGGYDGLLLLGVLKGEGILALRLTADGRLTDQFRLPGFEGTHGRIRTVQQGSDGALYVTTDNGGVADQVLRVTPRPRLPVGRAERQWEGPMPSADAIRDAQRATWAGLSGGWEKWDRVIMDQLGPVGAAMIERLDVAEDQQHLDIASGTGEPGLSIARRAPRGRVVLTDLAPEMLAVAVRRAEAQAVPDVEAAVCSADALPFGDAVFDSVSVRFGYMFFPDPATATAEFARVLRPGGRLCASVWAGPDENPWTTILMRAIETEVVLPPPDPDAPSMFRYAAPGQVGAVYEAAGLHDVVEWDVGVELVTSSPDEYWQMMSEHVSLAVAAFRQVDEPARERIRARVLSDARAYAKDGAVRVPGVARCIAGTRVSRGSA